MRTFSQQPKTTQSNKSSKLDRTHARQPDQNSIVNLQRAIGNQAFKRLLQSNAGDSSGAAAGLLQTKLAISKPEDEYEQEAEHVAEQVMRMPNPQGVGACERGGPIPASFVTGQSLKATLAQAVQRAPGAGTMLYRAPATNLRGYTEAERRAIQQSTIPASMIDSAFLQSVFGPPTQDTGVTYVFGGTTVFDPSIPAALHRGLASTGTHLADNTNVLPLGTTQSLVLNLTPFSGPNAIFRFTHLNHTENSVTAAVLLIENVGPAPAAIAPVTAPSGSFRVRGQNFIAGPGWNDQQFGRLQGLLATLPDLVLTESAGTTFALRGQGTQDEAGHYDAAHDTIEMHLNAFPAAVTTFGGADTGTRNIAHEIGHLLDLRRLERAWRTFNTGGQTATGGRTMFGERSLSGTRWTLAASGNYEQIADRRTATGNDFRVAAIRDGVTPRRTATDPLSGGPTTYSNTDWQELFAESFSLYITDPRLFELIRPNLFAYFSSRYPLRAAPAAATPMTPGAARPTTPATSNPTPPPRNR
jgi:hypothetical protein